MAQLSLGQACALCKDLAVPAGSRAAHTCAEDAGSGRGAAEHAEPASLISGSSLPLTEADPGMAFSVTDIAIIAGELACQGPS